MWHHIVSFKTSGSAAGLLLTLDGVVLFSILDLRSVFYGEICLPMGFVVDEIMELSQIPHKAC
jgi:hypothetical protein